MDVSTSLVEYLKEFLLGPELAGHYAYTPGPWFARPEMPSSPVREFEGMPMPIWNGDEPDFIASAFFFLSRYEELLNRARDCHGRFPGVASLAYRNHFLQRPIVDEYSHYLRRIVAASVKAGAEEPRVQGVSRLYLTHDVDVPFRRHPILGWLHQLASNLKHHKAPLWPSSIYTFPWLLDFDQRIVGTCGSDRAVAVYFLLARRKGKDSRDNWYLADKRCHSLVRSLEKYGVTIGLHVSYAAGGDLRRAVEEVGCLESFISPQSRPIRFSRHHYLRLTDPSDFVFLERTGITDDFSVGYADVAGFRVGTCRPFRWINPRTGDVGKLVVHPLTIMDCTLDAYMGLSKDQAYACCRNLIHEVSRYGGECVLLWHNTSLVESHANWQRGLYQYCVQLAAERVREITETK